MNKPRLVRPLGDWPINTGLVPTVREALENCGEVTVADIPEFSAASVSAVLCTMVKRGKAERVGQKDGRVLYRKK